MISESGTASYVIFGKSQNFPPAITPVQIAGTYGLLLTGGDGTYGQTIFGGCIDLNGDGIGDILISNPSIGANGAGAAYLAFGSASLPSVIDMSSLNGGSIGVVFDGTGNGANAGGTLGIVHNYRGNNFDSLLIGQPTQNNAFAIFGRALAFASPFLLTNVTSSNGLVLQGGTGALGGEDYNGDGRGDIVIGNYSARNVQVQINSTDGNQYLVTVNGDVSSGYLGLIAEGVGDINQDGFGDVAIGSYAGRCGILFGAAVSANVTLAESSLDSSTWADAGLCGDRASLRPAGDFNGDGIADVIVVRSSSDAAVLFGRPGFTMPASFNGLGPNIGVQLLLPAPFDGIGRATVVGIGDVNGDGVDDIAVGLPTSSIDALGGGAVAIVYGVKGLIFRNGFEQ